MKTKVVLLSIVLATSLFGNVAPKQESTKKISFPVLKGKKIQSLTHNTCVNDFFIEAPLTGGYHYVEKRGELLSIQDFIMNKYTIDFTADKGVERLGSINFFTNGFYFDKKLFVFEESLKESFLNQILESSTLVHTACLKETNYPVQITDVRQENIKTVNVELKTQKLIENLILELTISNVIENAEGGILLSNSSDMMPKNWLNNEDLKKRIETLKITNDEKFNKLVEIEKIEKERNTTFTVWKSKLLKVVQLKSFREQV